MMGWFRFGFAMALALGFVTAAQAYEYNAGATALWNDSNGEAHVAIGYSGGSTGQAAVNAAMTQCRNAGGPNCKPLGPFDEGCFYLTVGSRRHGTTWGSGPTREAATEKCEEGGYDCDPPIGGCVDR